MKRIAYLLAEFPVLSETFVGNEIRAMEQHGHAVMPILMRRAHGMAQPEDFTLADRALELAEAPRGMGALLWPGAHNLARALAFAKSQNQLPLRSLLYQSMRIAQVLKRSRIDHIHAHFAGGAAAHAICAARLAGITASFVCHGHDVYSEPENLVEKLNAADLVVAVCRDLARDLHAFAPRAKVATVPCGINPERFTFAGQPQSNGRLLFIGRLVEQKGLDDLIRALAALPARLRPGLDIVGDGVLRGQIEAMAQKFGLKEGDIRFLGPQPASWFVAHGPAYLGLAAPFKCALDGARDTGPLVVKEAMALGLPVISTAFMGVKDMITPECGWLVQPGDAEALASAISALLTLKPDMRESMIGAARKRVVEHFTLEQSARSLSNAFEALPC